MTHLKAARHGVGFAIGAILMLVGSGCLFKKDGAAASATSNPTPTPSTSALPLGEVVTLNISGTATPLAGACVPLTITGLDANANNVSADQEVVFAIDETGGSNTLLFLDAACSNYVAYPYSSMTLNQGESQLMVYVQDNVPEAITLTASYNSNNGSTWSAAFQPQTIDHITVTTSGALQACMPVTAFMFNASGVGTIQSANNLTLNFSNISGTGHFYSNSSCTTSTTSVTIAGATASNPAHTLYYGGAMTGTSATFDASILLPSGSTYSQTGYSIHN